MTTKWLYLHFEFMYILLVADIELITGSICSEKEQK